MRDEDKTRDELIHEMKGLRQAVADSQARENLFRIFLDHSPVIAWMKDSAGKHVYLSKSYEKRFGVRLEDWIGKTDFEVWPQEIAAEFSKNDQLALSTDQSIDIMEETVDEQGKKQYWWSCKFISRDQQGKKYVCGVGVDITKQKNMEELLRESEERYRSLFHNNHAVLLVIDPETGQIIDANPAACRYYGYEPGIFRTKRITDINTASSDDIFQEMTRAKAEQRQHFFFSHRLADGEIRPVEVYSGPILISGKQMLYSVVHDISDRKKAEEEREALILELKDALSRIKRLSGLLPICASCKKIRDDRGYWKQIESYISDHSEAEFSHGICPDCMKRLYPDMDD